MCLYSLRKTLKKSESDKECYKVVRVTRGLDRRKYRWTIFTGSFIEGSIMNGDVLFSARGKRDIERVDDSVRVGAGYIHSFVSIDDAEKCADDFSKANPGNTFEVWKCIIPHNIGYYYGATSWDGSILSYASRSVKFVKRLNEYKQCVSTPVKEVL